MPEHRYHDSLATLLRRFMERLDRAETTNIDQANTIAALAVRVAALERRVTELEDP